MLTFKSLYSKATGNDLINEDIGDILGDLGDKAKDALKAKLGIEPGGTNIMSRLFNAENDIIKLLDTKQYKALGKFLIDKKIAQDFVFKRITLFTGKNAVLGTKSATYRDVPLFHAITAMLIDGKNGNLIGSLNNIFTEIKSAGLSIKEWLNRVDSNHKDIISFILLASTPNISQDPTKPSEYEKMCVSLINTMMLYGYDASVNQNLPIHTTIRMKSLPILKAFFEGKVKAKFTKDIEEEADQVNNPAISAYIETIKSGNVTTLGATAAANKLDFSKYGYNPKFVGKQKLQQSAAIVLATDIAKMAGKPLDDAKLKTFAANKGALQISLVAALQKLDLPHDIAII